MIDYIHRGEADGEVVRNRILAQLFINNEFFGEVEQKLGANRAGLQFRE